MNKTTVKELQNSSSPKENVTLCGWIRTRRDSKAFSFLEINDGSSLSNIQCILDEGTAAYSTLTSENMNINTGAAVKIIGDLIESPGKGQKWEIKASEMEVFGLADPETFPIQKKRHTDEYLRTIAHLRPRSNKYGATFRIRSAASFAVHEYFKNEGFYYVHTPILTGADCEGAGEMFKVTTLPDGKTDYKEDFFGKQAHLTVSGQLEAETMAMALGKVYTFGPTFRAENSNTPRHAAEFWMIEPEMAFADLEDDMLLGEGLTKYVLKYCMENCEEDLALFDQFVSKGLLDSLKNIVSTDFHKIPYNDAVDILLKSNKDFEYKVVKGQDLQTEHERFLTEEYFKGPVSVYNYPKGIKAFYMRMNDDNETVAAMDLLVPRIGELIGGSQREERLDLLEKRIIELGQDPKDYWWYLDLRRFGTAPHAGFGMGFERMLMLLTGISNIRDVIPFPRTPDNLEF